MEDFEVIQVDGHVVRARHQLEEARLTLRGS